MTHKSPSLAQIIAASSVGTMIEFYDFFIFASLAPVLATQFYPPSDANVGFFSTLLTLAVGVAVRPIGSLIFGRVGDTVGRKTTFLITLLIMGGSTAAIGMLPGFKTIGYAAPVLLLLLRISQGLALGGEYAGAATYVAEHAPEHRRGFYTGFVQAMPTVGLFVSTVSVLAARALIGEPAFSTWGWRVPFLVSIVLVVVSYYMRKRLEESPIFSALKRSGRTSPSPIRESFATWDRLRVALAVLLGISAGQAVLAYTSQVYVLFFLQRTLKVPTDTTYVVMAVALFFVAPVFLAVGALSDRVGRKRLMMAGNLLGALIFYPVYRGLAHFANPLNTPMLAFLLFVQMLPIAIVFGPFAAYTVETFPARIRYTSVSVPYHIGNGWFGGFLPLIASAIVARTQNTFSWLLYPIAVLVMSVIVGSLFIDESFQNRIWKEVEQQQTPA